MFKVVFLLLGVGCLAAFAQHLDRKEYVVFHEEVSGNIMPNCQSATVFLICKVNWIGAIEFCHRLRMKPAVINNADEQHHIEMAIALTQNPPCDPRLGQTSYYWIGGSKLSNRHEFIWEPTGHPFFFTKWDINQPNMEFNCAAIKYSSSTQEKGQWLLFDCDKPLQSFVCEASYE